MEEEEEIWPHPTNARKRSLGQEEEEGENGGYFSVTKEQRQQEKDSKILGRGREEATNTRSNDASSSEEGKAEKGGSI